jgi:DNA-directed RNA polymerase specialized sigma subunit
VMGLRYYAGLSRAETGARIGISGKAVERAERAAIAALQELLLLPRAA